MGRRSLDETVTRVETPEEATRNVHPHSGGRHEQDDQEGPWTREDFLRDLSKTSRRHRASNRTKAADPS